MVRHVHYALNRLRTVIFGKKAIATLKLIKKSIFVTD